MSAVASRMNLSSIIGTKKIAPQRTIVFGVDGVGKSEWAAHSQSNIFIASEEGLNNIDAKAFPEPSTMNEVFECIATLYKDDHQYKTLTIDTLDWLEPLLIRNMCEKNGWKDIESAGYGKGHQAVPDEWRILLARLDELRRARGMEIILLAHAAIRPFKNPAGNDYDRYEMMLHKQAIPIVKQWADCVMFAVFEEFTTDPAKGKIKGVSSGKRVLKTQRTAAWDSKNRYGLPETLPLDYNIFVQARATGLDIDIEAVSAKCLELSERLKYGEKGAKYIEKIKDDPAELIRALNSLSVKAMEAGIPA